MKTNNRLLIIFEEIDFNNVAQLIKVDFLNYVKEHKSIYIDFFDFEEWLNKNNMLLLEDTSGEVNIKFKDLITDSYYSDYRNQLVKDFIKDLLNLHHILENIANQTIIRRLKEEISMISQELKSMYRLSA